MKFSSGSGGALVIAAAVISAHATIAAMGTVVEFGNLSDGDSYLRLLCIRELLETGRWFDSTIHRANAPYGFALHWTRPFDVIVVVLASIIAVLTTFSDPVHIASIVVGPIVHVFAALALKWAVTPLLGERCAVLAAVLTAFQMGIVSVSAFGVADHNPLFIFLTSIVTGWLIRSMRAERHIFKTAFLTGIGLGTSVWVGVEAYVFVGICMAVPAFKWLLGDPNGLSRNAALSFGFLVGITVATIVERGVSVFEAWQVDRVSMLHVLYSAAVFFGWGILIWLATRFDLERQDSRRVFFSLAVFLLVISAFWKLVTILPLDFFALDDPFVRRVFLRISEWQPLTGIAVFLYFLGGALIAVPYTGWQIFKTTDHERWAWIFVGMNLIVFVLLSIIMRRWAPYAGVFISVALASFLVWIYQEHVLRLRAWHRVPIVSALAIVIILGPHLSVRLFGDEPTIGKKCDVNSFIRRIGEKATHPKSLTIMTAAEHGPRILYETHHNVVATMHHGNRPGIIDSLRVLSSTNEDVALQLIRERKVDLIGLCGDETGKHYAWPLDSRRYLYRRLLNGDAPIWLASEAGAEPGELSFKLFWVVPEAYFPR